MSAQPSDDRPTPGTDPFGTVINPSPPNRRQASSSSLPVIGAYQTLHRIAGGSMGQVFLAKHQKTGQRVALKLIGRTKDHQVTEKERSFFIREMQVLNRLKHPRIVGIHDFGTVDGRLFLAMEYVRTIDLVRELVMCDLAQQIRMVCGIGCYVLDALAYAHSQNIVHRDIKPANILVFRNPQKDYKIGIKLADFGISKDVRQAGISGITREGEMRGTPAYMSPEQLTNARDVGPPSDLYSTAAVLYFWLTGLVPHQLNAKTPVRFHQVVEGRPIPLASRRTELPQGLCEVIDRGLAPLDQGRFPSAIEFNQALLRFTRKLK